MSQVTPYSTGTEYIYPGRSAYNILGTLPVGSYRKVLQCDSALRQLQTMVQPLISTQILKLVPKIQLMESILRDSLSTKPPKRQELISIRRLYTVTNEKYSKNFIFKKTKSHTLHEFDLN